MTTAQSALYENIRSFDIDGEPVSYSFAHRLARENGWSAEFTARAIEEYRKFLFLAAEAGHPVTPSEEVDEVWHLHILYTESYWTRLCGEVLPRPLHHGPTKGGKAESDKFTDWYARTLASYRQFFGTEPPADLWPDSKTRFAPKPKSRQVDAGEHWVISKRAVKRTAIATVGIGGLAAVLTGCDPSKDPVQPMVLFLVFGGVLVLMALVIYAVRQANRGNSGGSGCSTHTSGCSGFDSGHHSGGHSHGHDGGGHGHGGHDGGGHDGGSDGGGGDSGCGSGCGGGCGGGGD